MKFTAAIFSALLASSTAFASHVTRGHDVIQARQAKLRRGYTVDICADIDVDLALPSIVKDNKAFVAGHLDTTLCISMLPTFCQQNQIAKTASLLVGVDVVVGILTEHIKNSGKKHECQLPEHGHSTCSKGSPCAFGCSDGYEPYTPGNSVRPTKCYCAPGKMECNGQCGSFPNGCGSAAPKPKPKDKRNHRRHDERCSSSDETVCGVEGSDGWDCIDTKSDKESCGGCMVPSPFSTDKFVPGKDCTAIPHVSHGGVDCLGGSCFVHDCEDGFVPSKAHDSCVPKY